MTWNITSTKNEKTTASTVSWTKSQNMVMKAWQKKKRRYCSNRKTIENEEENKNIEIEQVTKSTYDYKNYKEITLYHTSTKKTEKVPLDEYLYGVVSAEMPASFEEEALKAQAVVARTYTLYKIQNSKRKT